MQQQLINTKCSFRKNVAKTNTYIAYITHVEYSITVVAMMAAVVSFQATETWCTTTRIFPLLQLLLLHVLLPALAM